MSFIFAAGAAVAWGSLQTGEAQAAVLDMSPGVVVDQAEFAALSRKCAPTVPYSVLSALIKTESSFHPLAIATRDGRSFYPSSLDEAKALIRQLHQDGAGYAAGLGQISSDNLDALGLEGNDLFDPCINLRAASAVLDACQELALSELQLESPLLSAVSPVTAGKDEPGKPKTTLRRKMLGNTLSCYFSGNTKFGWQDGYVDRVLSAMESGKPKLMNNAKQDASVFSGSGTGLINISSQAENKGASAPVF